MELDELKKSWSALDARLKDKPIAQEQQIEELISRYKTHSGKSLKRLIGVQRFSIGIGIIVLLALIGAGIWLLQAEVSAFFMQRALAMFAFLALTLIAGLWWDTKTYRFSRDIRMDEMPVAEVSRRMQTFRRWMNNEVLALVVWALLFDALYYWCIGLHQADMYVQAIAIGMFLVYDALVIYLFYKLFIYKHLNSIRKDIEEIEKEERA